MGCVFPIIVTHCSSTCGFRILNLSVKLVLRTSFESWGHTELTFVIERCLWSHEKRCVHEYVPDVRRMPVLVFFSDITGSIGVEWWALVRADVACGWDVHCCWHSWRPKLSFEGFRMFTTATEISVAPLKGKRSWNVENSLMQTPLAVCGAFRREISAKFNFKKFSRFKSNFCCRFLSGNRLTGQQRFEKN